jgi:hypothetical protein
MFFAPVLLVLDVIGAGASAGLMMGAAMAGVGLKLAKEMVSTVPTVKAMIVKLLVMVGIMPQSKSDKVVARRDVTGLLLEMEATNPTLMHAALAAVDNEITAAVRTYAADTIQEPLAAYQKEAVAAAEEWRKGAGGVLIAKATELQELDKISAPHPQFRLTAMTAVAPSLIRKLKTPGETGSPCLTITHRVDKLAQASVDNYVGATQVEPEAMHEHFSSLCQELVVGAIADPSSKIALLIVDKVDGIVAAEKQRQRQLRKDRAEDAVKAGLAQQDLVDEEHEVEEGSIMLSGFPGKAKLLGCATEIVEAFARRCTYEALVAANQRMVTFLAEAADVPHNDVPVLDADSREHVLSMLNPTYDEETEGAESPRSPSIANLSLTTFEDDASTFKSGDADNVFEDEAFE